MTLGDIVKNYREENKMSMDEFSKRSKLSKGYISMLENNINPRNNKPIAPTLPTIEKIALGIGSDVDTILKALDGNQKVSLEPEINSNSCELSKESYTNGSFSFAELQLIEKYRFISKHLPTGIEMVDYILNHEYEEAKELKERLNELVKQASRIAELESRSKNIIEYQPRCNEKERMANYYHSVSAGSGVFIMGNEVVDQIPIPDTPENRNVDYAISVSGNSMEPDFYDGDIVLVSQKEEIRYGDVGIFIINGDAYIKEYGETELVSRNPNVDNIEISEYDNIVCMGKVLGKVDN